MGQRQVVILIITALVAAGIATAATLLLSNNDDTAIATLAPPTFTPLPTESPSPSPTASASPSASPSTSTTPSSTSTASPSTPAPSTQIRSASSVDCNKESDFCSPLNGANITNDKYTNVDEPNHTYSGVPTISMDSTMRKGDKTEAREHVDDVSSLHAVVTVENKTSKTFRFNKREIVFDLFRNGKLYDTLSTTGAGFDMTPGAKMTGTFDRPITEDGNYSWRAKTWYYEK